MSEKNKDLLLLLKEGIGIHPSSFRQCQEN